MNTFEVLNNAFDDYTLEYMNLPKVVIMHPSFWVSFSRKCKNEMIDLSMTDPEYRGAKIRTSNDLDKGTIEVY